MLKSCKYSFGPYMKHEILQINLPNILPDAVAVELGVQLAGQQEESCACAQINVKRTDLSCTWSLDCRPEGRVLRMRIN
jgi:hypothetical protein